MSEAALPKWATNIFADFSVDLITFTRLQQLSMNGLTALNSLAPDTGEIWQSTITEALELAVQVMPTLPSETRMESVEVGLTDLSKILLENEVRRGFPSLRAHGFILFWSALENFITDFIALWLENEPSAVRIPIVAKLMEQAARRTDIKSDRKLTYVIDRLERETDARLKVGVQRSECMLAVFGLDGAVDDRTRKYLAELHQLRNIIVHNKGIVDQRFCDACPWADVMVGEALYIDRETYRSCFYALYDYSDTIYNRIAAFYGKESKSRDFWRKLDALEHLRSRSQVEPPRPE